MGARLADEVFAAPDAQTVVVPGTTAAAAIVPSLAGSLTAVLDQRKALAVQIEKLLEAHHPLSKVLSSVPGIGVRTGARILVEIGDGSTFPTAAHLASYAGLAPVTRRSGSSIRGGNVPRRGNRLLKRAFLRDKGPRAGPRNPRPNPNGAHCDRPSRPAPPPPAPITHTSLPPGYAESITRPPRTAARTDMKGGPFPVPTVAEQIVATLADCGVRTAWGVVGDALNPVTDAIRREDRMEWIGTRHEEVAAFAAGAQAQLTGVLGLCMGTVGPGSIHLLNGLYDAKKSRVPVLAICGQVPLAELGSDYFQEVDSDLLFRDVADFRHTITSPEQMPRVLQQAIHTAYAGPGVAVLILPGDVGAMKAPDAPALAGVAPLTAPQPRLLPAEEEVERAAAILGRAATVTMLVGTGAHQARQEVLAMAEHLSAPMVLTLKAKEWLEADNPYQIGQSGLIGNPATKAAFDAADALLMVGTDFPYPEWIPAGTPTVQIDVDRRNIGRRTPVAAGVVGDAGLTLAALRDRVAANHERKHLDKARLAYLDWVERQQRITDPGRSTPLFSRFRSKSDPDAGDLIRPESLAAALDRHAAGDAVFTGDTGMSVVWLSRFVTLGGGRRLIGSFNLGSMANAMPHALGASAADRRRQVIACCGDGGLTMLLGDLITAVSYDLPVKFIVFDNGRLGMVKLEQEQGGLPEFGTVLANPDLAAVARAMGMESARVTDPDALDAAVAEALSSPKPYLLDVVTDPAEIALPPKTTVGDAWGFAIAKVKEELRSEGE